MGDEAGFASICACGAKNNHPSLFFLLACISRIIGFAVFWQAYLLKRRAAATVTAHWHVDENSTVQQHARTHKHMKLNYFVTESYVHNKNVWGLAQREVQSLKQ